jgi:hypothetical protein
VGYHFGLILSATDKLTFGIRYLSRQKVHIDNGNATFSQINTNILLPQRQSTGPPGSDSAGCGVGRPIST